MEPSAYDWMPVAAEVLFFSIFALVLWYVCTDRRRGHIDHMGHAPLDDGVGLAGKESHRG